MFGINRNQPKGLPNGALSASNIPLGSPLVPPPAVQNPASFAGGPDPLAPLPAMSTTAQPQTPMGVLQQAQAPQAPIGALQQTPPAPQGTIRKKVSPFDKEHLSATLAKIGAGFASSPMSFAGGLAAAASNVAGFADDLREQGKAKTTIGGPDNGFEISVDPVTGQRTYRAIPEFQKYLLDEREAELAAKRAAAEKPVAPKDYADLIGRAAQAVANGMEATEARQALIGMGVPEGVIPTNLSSQYSAFGGTVPQIMGQSVARDRLQETKRANSVREGQGDRRIAISQQNANKPKSSGGGKSKATQPPPPGGFIPY